MCIEILGGGPPVREDFERKLYHRRSKVHVRFVELTDTIPVHRPETEVIDQMLFGDFLPQRRLEAAGPHAAASARFGLTVHR